MAEYILCIYVEEGGKGSIVAVLEYTGQSRSVRANHIRALLCPHKLSIDVLCHAMYTSPQNHKG